MIRKIFTGMICLYAGLIHAQTSAPVRGATCVSTGIRVVTETIRVPGGTYDGGCKTFVPGPGMESTSHSETHAAKALMFRLENGAKLRNVIISPASAPTTWSARPIAIYGGATLENVNITRGTGDTSISIKTPGLVTMTRVTSVDSDDRHIYVGGSGTTVNISNCVFRKARKVYRHSGANTLNHVSITGCEISDMTDQVFRTDSVAASAVLNASQLINVRTICTGYAPGRCIVQPGPFD